MPDIVWHGLKLDEPGWFDLSARVLAFTLAASTAGEEDLHVILNMSDRSLDMPLYVIPAKTWHLAMDTSLPSPEDIPEPSGQMLVKEVYRVSPRTVVVFESRSGKEAEEIKSILR